MYGNQPGLTMCKKDRVSWHMIGMGTDTDMHGVYFQGNTIHFQGTHHDTLALFPHISKTVFMQPDHAGKLGRAISGDFRHVLLRSSPQKKLVKFGHFMAYRKRDSLD